MRCQAAPENMRLQRYLLEYTGTVVIFDATLSEVSVLCLWKVFIK